MHTAGSPLPMNHRPDGRINRTSTGIVGSLLVIMTNCAKHSTASLYDRWTQAVPIGAEQPQLVHKVADLGMKLLLIFGLWTLFLDLNDVAAATSTATLSIRPSRSTISNHQYGMQIPRPEIVGLLNDVEVEDSLNGRLSIGLDKEIEVNSKLSKLQAFNVQRRAQKKSKNIAAKQQSREFSGGEHMHMGDDYDKKMYAISITSTRELVDNDKGESGGAIITELDRPVAWQIKSRAESSSSKHISELVERSNLEADNVILQPANKASDPIEDDDAGQNKLKKQLQEKKTRPHHGQADVDSGVHDTSKNYHESAESMTRTATVIDEDYGSVIHSAASPPVKTKTDAEEVVMTEERDEDKKLIPDYNLGEPIKDWNRKRQEWARQHPELKQEQLFILTGTQPWPCNNAEGDHLLLRCFKNKVDYSRIHGVGLFYNTALLDAHMPTFWAKLPVVRATMLAHPEVEWIWWLDADAIITDMEFSIPLHRYSAYNLVVHGWESLIFEKRSWLGLNAGSFLLRNCQWSLELLERWASMGPKAPMGDAYRHILSDFLPDRPRNPTDDQAALVFLLIKERQNWAGNLRVELDFFLSGYWLELMDGFEATEERYRAMEEQHAELWELLERQGAVGKEKLVAAVGRAREQHLSASGTSVQQRRAFITHFTGCQPCSGHHNNIYSSDQCRNGLLRALNYADDQVLRTLGYHHRALHLPDVLPSASTA